MSEKSKSKSQPLINPKWTIPEYLMDLGWDISEVKDECEVTEASELSHRDFPGVSILFNDIAIDGDAAFGVLIAKIYKQAVAYGRNELMAESLLQKQAELEI